MPSFFLQAQCPQTGLLNNLWGLDRIDQANTTGDGKYETPGCNCGTGVNIFVLDTGVRLSHLDFADREGISKDFVNNDNDGADGKAGWLDTRSDSKSIVKDFGRLSWDRL